MKIHYEKLVNYNIEIYKTIYKRFAWIIFIKNISTAEIFKHKSAIQPLFNTVKC